MLVLLPIFVSASNDCYIASSCNSGDNPVFSVYQNSITHVSFESSGKTPFCFFDTVNVNENFNCNFRSDCLADEFCIVSVYSNDNTHVADCSVNTGMINDLICVRSRCI
ncbi:MAG: hypothetical protein ACLFN8_05535 [Candidatus Woesearchaeota archaeon]